ncbi:MAG: hypothetical protein EON59_06775 [Alphaproteobacteria bacterium]|nr:MAG: hypothetical protein EON59_06775 [Alphaproteobacteria bacterium]
MSPLVLTSHQQQKGDAVENTRIAKGNEKVWFQAPGGNAGGGSLKFFPGLHQPGDAKHFDRACISIHRLETRRKPVACPEVMIDSGAFTKLAKHGGYPEPVDVYAAQLYRLHTQGVVRIAVAAAQDYMCEPFMLARTGLTVADHQRLTIERYDALLSALHDLFDGPPPFPMMPVLQGFTVADYLRHLADYGDRLTPDMWVGVGSVCKRQGNVSAIEIILHAIKEVRPDLRLHGFRRKGHGPSKRLRPPPSLQRGQHGVVVQRPEAGSRRQRLARSRGIPFPHRRGAGLAQATRPVLALMSPFHREDPA